MKFDPQEHHRRSLRLRGFDYSQDGAFFVTICTQHRICLLGEIVGEEMILNDAGKMVQAAWDEIPFQYPGFETDERVVMPNHLHGILVIQTKEKGNGQEGQTLSLPDVVKRWKTLTTKRYSDAVKQHRWPPFPGKLWQRNYYEHIIRNEEELNHVREYIFTNPLKWIDDKENPAFDPHSKKPL